MPCPALPMPCHAVPCRAAPCRAVPCHALPCPAHRQLGGGRQEGVMGPMCRLGAASVQPSGPAGTAASTIGLCRSAAEAAPLQAATRS